MYVSSTEMVVSMKNVAGMNVELTVEERNLLSVAYKNVIGARRASWRIISSIEQREENKGGEEKLKMIREYRQTVTSLRMSRHICKQLYLDHFCQEHLHDSLHPIVGNIFLLSKHLRFALLI